MSTVLVAIVAYVLFLGWICGRLKEVGDRLLLHDRTPLTPTVAPPYPLLAKGPLPLMSALAAAIWVPSGRTRPLFAPGPAQ